MKAEKAIETVFGNRYKLSKKRAKEFLIALEKEAQITTKQNMLDMQAKSKFYFDARWGEGWEANV